MSNVYKIKREKFGRYTVVEGTIDDLVFEFSYVLPENKKPKTIHSFVNSLKRIFEKKESNSKFKTQLSLIK